MNEKIKALSPLVTSVTALDSYFSDLVRIGSKIETMELKSGFDQEQLQKLLLRFSECSEGVSEQILLMSQALTEARAEAEAAAQVVSLKAEQLHNRQFDQQNKMNQFQALGEKVRLLTVSLAELKTSEGETPSEERRVEISRRFTELQTELDPLIKEAHLLKLEGQLSKLKILEQGADSLGQSLVSIQQKLSNLGDVISHH